MFFSVCLCFTLAAAGNLYAQGNGSLFTVNSPVDSTDASPGDGLCADATGQCTLRAAISESNALNPDLGRNAIIFALPQPAVIALTLGKLSVIKNLDIVGPGARRLTVQRSIAVGTPNFRIFHVPAGQTSLNIYGITIRNGNANADAGGGLFIESGNSASLTDVAVSGNHAMAGGGIANFGTLSILRSLINSNASDNQGGAITNVSSIANTTITSSTLTGNSASFGGAIDNGGSLLLINDTISRNSASLGSSGVFNSPLGTARVLNTIIGRDISQSVPMLQGAFQSLGNNLISLSGPSTGFIDGVNGDQVGSFNPIDPLLGSLADNGGQTDTLALQTGSTAINNGNNCVTTGQCPQLPGIGISGRLDQRRYRRGTFGGVIDIGAFEMGATSSSGNFSFGVFGGGGRPAGRFLGSIVILINATTLEKRYSLIRLNDGYSFNNIPTADAFVIEIKAKRRGLVTPQVIAFDF